MFKKSFDDIMDEMKVNVPNGMDVSEGSILYDALAPMALALEKAYMDMDSIIELAFADTSNGKYLSMRAEEFGVTRKEALQAKIEGQFNIDVPTNSRFYVEGFYFTVYESGKLICETPGKIPNIEGNELIPVNNIEGLTAASVTSIIFFGEDEESDEDLLMRLHHKVRNPATSGNVGHYKLWANSVNGVSDSRIIPKHDGVGTVKVIVIDNDKRAPDSAVIQEVQEYIEEVRPIGIEVTVQGPKEVSIDIQCTIQVSEGADLDEAKATVINNIEEYLRSIAFKVDEVRYSRILNNIFQVEAVEDCIDLVISSQDTLQVQNKNIILNTDEVAVIGQVTFYDS